MSVKATAYPAFIQERDTLPASFYDADALAAIYNESRIDYIVPMPMNGRRMADYIRHHDVDLDASIITVNGQGDETGIGMLGRRDTRAWITRLGVMPSQRGQKLGQYLMEKLLESAILCGARRVQLEVIMGNEPAYRLFRKFGFEDTRELLVIRRPPGILAADAALDNLRVTPIAVNEMISRLQTRTDAPSWIEETPSLMNAGGLYGLEIETPAQQTAWIVFQRTPFQLTHMVLGSACDQDTARALLYHVHRMFPMQDTKVENIPADGPAWGAYQQMGYMEVFRRIEMVFDIA